jgi:hypothetical protein
MTSQGIMDQWTIRKDFKSERERERGARPGFWKRKKRSFRIETVILGAHAQKGNTSSVWGERARERENLNKRNGIQKLLLQKQNKLTHHSLPNPKKNWVSYNLLVSKEQVI